MSQTPNQEQPRKHPHTQQEGHPPKRNSQGRVFTYLAILFAAAFLLLLLAFLMQQRANREAISNLTQSVTDIHSLQNLVEANASLQQQVEDLEDQLARLNEAYEKEVSAHQEQAEARTATQDALDKAQAQLAAMDYFRQIQRYYYKGSYRSARAVVEAMEAAGVADALPDTTHSETTDPSILSPAEEYKKIREALY